jgi:DNA-binding CsgD family transcriptional regulator
VGDDRIGEIYEAAVLTDAWPTLLENLGRDTGSIGGLLFTASDHGVKWLGSPQTVKHRNDFMAMGWNEDNDRVYRLIEKRHAGFLTETDLYPMDDLDELPVRKQFLIPRGLIAANATAIDGFQSELIIVSIEGFSSHEAARAAIPYLDGLRPHMARATALSSQLRLQQAQSVVAALELVKCAAGVVSKRRHLVAANSAFEIMFGSYLQGTAKEIHLRDRRADQIFEEALDRIGDGACDGRSIVVGDLKSESRLVLHVIPVAGAARDIFRNLTAILIAASPRPDAKILDVTLLKGLFDLTAAETHVAHYLIHGERLDGVARQLGVSQETVRTHLKRIFRKVGVSRQQELLAVLGSIARP